MAFVKGITIQPGYEQPMEGGKVLVNFDRTGPASYVRFVSPSTGGDKINAADLQRGGFDNVDSMIDTTGQIAAYIIPVLGGNGNAVPSVIIAYYALVTATLGGQSQTIGTQIAAGTNLSTFSWRYQAIMV